MELLLVGIGGSLGSLARYTLGKRIAEQAATTFPVGTFIINISGALLLGIVSALEPGRSASLLVADGFLGAYTTFSTFMYEGFNLFAENEKLNAAVYITGSLILGIIGYIIGFFLVKIVVR